jgi:hypothetical protein
MPEQAEEAQDSDDPQRTGSDEQQEQKGADTREQGRSERCRFDDFAMI